MLGEALLGALPQMRLFFPKTRRVFRSSLRTRARSGMKSMLCRASARGVRPPLPRCGTSAPASLSQNWAGCEAHEVRSRKDRRGVDLISNALRFGRLWHGKPNVVANAIVYANQRNRSHASCDSRFVA